jgi:hypothetical protein
MQCEDPSCGRGVMTTRSVCGTRSLMRVHFVSALILTFSLNGGAHLLMCVWEAGAMAGDLSRLRGKISEQSEALSRCERSATDAQVVPVSPFNLPRFLREEKSRFCAVAMQDAFAAQLERVLAALAAEREKSERLASLVCAFAQGFGHPVVVL